MSLDVIGYHWISSGENDKEEPYEFDYDIYEEKLEEETNAVFILSE